jgi:exocyst complex component 4
MSRVPPFPTSSVRRPSVSNGDGSGSVQSGPSPAATSVRPLQINRSQSHSRPEIPTDRSTRVGSSRVVPGVISPTGPARPQRSDLRSRQISESTNSIARDRDSVMTTRSDASVHRNGPSVASQPVEGRPRPERSMTARSDDSQTSLRSPETLPAVLSAFTSAGARRRQMAERSRDLEYEREKAQEAETHRQRQQRINDRAPGKRLNGRARPGDIDGMFTTLPRSDIWAYSLICFASRLAVLDQIKEQWEFVIDPEVRSKLPRLTPGIKGPALW